MNRLQILLKNIIFIHICKVLNSQTFPIPMCTEVGYENLFQFLFAGTNLFAEHFSYCMSISTEPFLHSKWVWISWPNRTRGLCLDLTSSESAYPQFIALTGVHCALSSIDFVFCTVHCLWITVHIALCTVYCILGTVHCLLCTIYWQSCRKSRLVEKPVPRGGRGLPGYSEGFKLLVVRPQKLTYD